MAVKNVRSIVAHAAVVPLSSPVTVYGNGANYFIGSNMLSFDNTHNYLLSQISATFGQTTGGSTLSTTRFKCGDGDIDEFDFGLLFSCFASMVSAYT